MRGGAGEDRGHKVMDEGIGEGIDEGINEGKKDIHTVIHKVTKSFTKLDTDLYTKFSRAAENIGQTGLAIRRREERFVGERSKRSERIGHWRTHLLLPGACYGQCAPTSGQDVSAGGTNAQCVYLVFGFESGSVGAHGGDVECGE
eukprot:354781-Prorocentrum_minimum.AAC.1